MEFEPGTYRLLSKFGVFSGFEPWTSRLFKTKCDKKICVMGFEPGSYRLLLPRKMLKSLPLMGFEPGTYRLLIKLCDTYSRLLNNRASTEHVFRQFSFF